MIPQRTPGALRHSPPIPLLGSRRNSTPTRDKTPKSSLLCQASSSARGDLLRAVFNAARKQTAPWLADLALPALGIDNGAATPSPTLHPSQLADADSRFAALPCGVELHYKYWDGDATKPLILLMHGFNASEFSWRATAPTLAAETGCRVVAFDRPPFGLSSRPLVWGEPGQTLSFNPYTVEGSAKLAGYLLEYLQARDVVVVGHSAGGMVALGLHNQCPEAVKAMVLVAPAVPSTPENSLQRRATFGSQLRLLATRVILQNDAAGVRFVRRQLLRQKDKVAGGDLGFKPHPATLSSSSLSSLSLDITTATATGSSIDSTIDDANASNFSNSDYFFINQNNGLSDEELAIKVATEGYLKPIKAHDWDRAALLNLRSLNWPMHYDYSSVKAPVFVVAGEYDGALTMNARALAEVLQQRPGQRVTKFVEFPCGHVPMEEMPLEFNAALTEFLNDEVLVL